MMFEKNDSTKLCSFYVSEWHLVTMLLPYINKKINEEAQIITILENDIEENIIKLLQNLNLKNKEKILNLNWKKVEKEKKIFSTISSREIIIIVNGSRNFIEKYNKRIDKYINTHILNSKIRIVNCYEITKFDGNISEILNNHHKLLNTSGEKEIKDVFDEYKEFSNQRKAI